MATAVIIVPTIVTPWLMNSSRNWRDRRSGPKSARQHGAAGCSPSRAMSADTAPRYAWARRSTAEAGSAAPARDDPAQVLDCRRVGLGHRAAVEPRLGVVLDP